MVFVPCTVDNQLTTLNQPNAQCSSLYIYLLTQCSTVILQKLTSSQLLKKLPAFYGTRRFITAFTSSRQPSLSCEKPFLSMFHHLTSWRPILILSFQLRLAFQVASSPQVSPPKPWIHVSSPYMLHALPISFFTIWSPK